jgi:predicted nucleic acid-binding protein
LILYLDTSALVKLYVDEAHSAFIRQSASEAVARVSHEIAYVECCAAFARRREDGSLAAADHARCRRQLDDDWERFSVIAVTTELMRQAARRSEEHVLRAYDSIHLAAAEAAAGVASGRTGFAFSAFDARLTQAAQARGLRLLGTG